MGGKTSVRRPAPGEVPQAAQGRGGVGRCGGGGLVWVGVVRGFMSGHPADDVTPLQGVMRRGKAVVDNSAAGCRGGMHRPVREVGVCKQFKETGWSLKVEEGAGYSGVRSAASASISVPDASMLHQASESRAARESAKARAYHGSFPKWDTHKVFTSQNATDYRPATLQQMADARQAPVRPVPNDLAQSMGTPKLASTSKEPLMQVEQQIIPRIRDRNREGHALGSQASYVVGGGKPSGFIDTSYNIVTGGSTPYGRGARDAYTGSPMNRKKVYL